MLRCANGPVPTNNIHKGIPFFASSSTKHFWPGSLRNLAIAKRNGIHDRTSWTPKQIVVHWKAFLGTEMDRPVEAPRLFIFRAAALQGDFLQAVVLTRSEAILLEKNDSHFSNCFMPLDVSEMGCGALDNFWSL